eukprot:NODE_383_length_8356_cov_0.477898.p4 type:complete len:251 gc:universal NODE_383_length_8356_cov_0.477898:2457-3209(+)
MNSLVSFSANKNLFTGGLPIFTPSLTIFSANRNKLNGPIPALGQFLKFLDIAQNNLTGHTPILNLQITNFNISSNRMNDDLTDTLFPNSLKTLDISFNEFNGTLFLKSPIYVDARNNRISSVSISSASSLIYCNVVRNLIKLDIPFCNFDLSNYIIPEHTTSVSTLSLFTTSKPPEKLETTLASSILLTLISRLQKLSTTTTTLANTVASNLPTDYHSTGGGKKSIQIHFRFPCCHSFDAKWDIIGNDFN